jgi:hypothetical protein
MKRAIYANPAPRPAALTEKAFRIIQSLTLRRLVSRSQRLRADIGRLGRWNSASIHLRMLMDMTRGVGIAR